MRQRNGTNSASIANCRQLFLHVTDSPLKIALLAIKSEKRRDKYPAKQEQIQETKEEKKIEKEKKAEGTSVLHCYTKLVCK